MSAFIKNVKDLVEQLRAVDTKTIFTIATTSKGEPQPYVTPLRVTSDFAVAGCVIFRQDCLLDIIEIVDGIVDIVLVDTEKKIPLAIHIETSSHSDDIYRERKTVGAVETGNLSKICFQKIKKSKTFEYKPNDLTVNSAWSFLSQRLGVLSGLKIAILGAGNIGSKLALKLVECGANVHTYRQQSHLGYQIASGLNLIKHDNTVSNITFHSNILSTTFGADVVVGCSNGVPVVDSDVIQSVNKGALIADLGKNNITPDAVKLAIQQNLEIYRVDVSAALEGFIYEMLRMNEIIENSYGAKDLEFCSLVSGGYFGKLNDIVVDNIDDPKIIYGVSNGDGTIKKVHSAENIETIAKLRNEIKEC